jgi:hypothetical protein
MGAAQTFGAGMTAAAKAMATVMPIAMETVAATGAVKFDLSSANLVFTLQA